jgi:hypothetical protein
VNKFLFLVLLLISLAARSEDWIVISTDNTSKLFLSNEKSITVKGKKLIKIKSTFNDYRDLMGLKYNSTISIYVTSCELDLVDSKQQFAFNDNELVWTFPETNKREKASLAIPKEALDYVCNY